MFDDKIGTPKASPSNKGKLNPSLKDGITKQLAVFRISISFLSVIKP